MKCQDGKTATASTGNNKVLENYGVKYSSKITELANEIRRDDNPEELFYLVSALFEICASK